MKELIRLLGLGSALLLSLAPATPSQAAPSPQSSVCDYYVDNTAGSDGNGSWSQPWKDIGNHVGTLFAGDTMCVRGDVAGAGRVYAVNQIYLNSNAGLVRNGASGNPITIRSYPGEKVLLQNVGSNSIFYLRGVDYWVIDGFVMDNNGRGSRLIRFEQDANYNILRNNEIYNGRVDGIALCCGRNVGNVIESNHIHHFDAGDIDAHGIVLEPGSDDTVIQGNVIHDSSGDAIQIYAVNSTPVSDYSKNVRIVDNVLYRGALARSENALDFKGADGLVVSGNELSGYALPAVVIQMGSRNLVFDNNIIHDSSYGIVAQGGGGKHSENITLRNNLLYKIGTHAILFTDVYGAIAHYNTIAYASGGSFRIGASGLQGGDIRNNLVYKSGKALVGSGVPFTNVTLGYNAWFDAASGITAPTDIAGSGDPGFVDAANGDYHLTAGSRARDAGIDVSVTADFENDARPFGNRTDIGADEYWPSLRLSAIPQDGALRLVWTKYDDPALTSYVIKYSYGAGGRAASQGASPISGISAATQSYELTGLTNYVLYTITLTARDGSGSELIESNSARVMPSDIFVYLPAMMKNSR